MNFNNSLILSLGAGLLSALLIQYNVYFICLLPIFFISLRHGLTYGLIAVWLASLYILLSGNFSKLDSIIYISLFLFPSWFISFLFNQHRPLNQLTTASGSFISVKFIETAFIKPNKDSNDKQMQLTAWYPLSAILFVLGMYLAVANTIIASQFLEIYADIVAATTKNQSATIAELAMTLKPFMPHGITEEAFKNLQEKLLLLSISSSESLQAFIIIIFNLFISHMFFKRNALFTRPLELWQEAVKLPLLGRLFFIVSYLLLSISMLTVISKDITTISLGPISQLFLLNILLVFLASLLFSGFAAVNNFIMNQKWRIPGLVIFYALFILSLAGALPLLLPALGLFLALGLFASRKLILPLSYHSI